jgi:hypothetical protein
MTLVDENDINVHLPEDKLVADAEPLLDEIYEDIERIIRGNLAGQIDSSEMATWLTPDTTPKLIRAIGGRLGAAFIYRRRYSEDSLDDPEYAQFKYNEAMMMIQGIIDGTLVLEEVPLEVGLALTTDMFYPNDPLTDPPKFSINSVF